MSGFLPVFRSLKRAERCEIDVGAEKAVVSSWYKLSGLVGGTWARTPLRPDLREDQQPRPAHAMFSLHRLRGARSWEAEGEA